MNVAVSALRFGLELVALFFLARWGWQLNAALWLRWLVSVAAPALALIGLGLWATPRSPFRLRDPAKFGFELLFYGAACLALLSQGAATTALIFGGLVLVMWAASFALGLRK